MIDRELVLRKLDMVRHHAALELLAGKSVIDAGLARNLIRASGLRNRLQHQYQTVDWKVVHSSIGDGLGDFDAFVKAIRAFIDASAAGGRPQR